MTLSFLQLSNDLWEGEEFEVLTASLHAGVTQEAVCKLWLRLLCFSSDVCVCLRVRAGQTSLDTRITFSLTWTWVFCEYDLCQRVLRSVADRKYLCLMLNETGPTFPEHCETTDWCKLVPVGFFYWGEGHTGSLGVIGSGRLGAVDNVQEDRCAQSSWVRDARARWISGFLDSNTQPVSH